MDGNAVSHGILTDYKVMVLAVDEAAIQKDMQKSLSDPENGLNIDDVGRIVGIWNGMMRRNGYKTPLRIVLMMELLWNEQLRLQEQSLIQKK